MTVQFDYGDVFFNETLYVADAVSYLGCSASTCSSSCDSSTPFTGTTCYDNQTCLNMTQGTRSSFHLFIFLPSRTRFGDRVRFVLAE